MGVKSDEALEVEYEELATYLRANHSMYMDVHDSSYYLTDVNERYWRVQDTTQFNDKGHYIDCSALVPTVGEFLELPFTSGRSIKDLFDEADFYASVKDE